MGTGGFGVGLGEGEGFGIFDSGDPSLGAVLKSNGPIGNLNNCLGKGSKSKIA